MSHSQPVGQNRMRISPCEKQMIDRVRHVVGGQCVTQTARRISMNHESVRRYLLGTTSAPAAFLLRIAENFDVNGHWLLTGKTDQAQQALQCVSTGELLAEVKRRAEMMFNEEEHRGTPVLSAWEQVAILCTVDHPKSDDPGPKSQWSF